MSGWKKLGMIAGAGDLPVRIASACNIRNDPVYTVRLQGITDGFTKEQAGDICAIGEIGKVFHLLKKNGCDAVVFAGTVRRPDFRSLKVDFHGARILPGIVSAAMQGDGELLRFLAGIFEKEGIRVAGVDEVVSELISPCGFAGDYRTDENDIADILKAVRIIDALGPFDVGQAAVVANGFVMAVEAAEGTASMLERCARIYRKSGASGLSGVLVKKTKPGQDMRMDLPVIGLQTVHAAYTAGLRGIALEAGRAIILDRKELVRTANGLGMFVYGFNPGKISEHNAHAAQE